MQDFFRRQHSVRIAGWSGKTRREPGDVARADRAGMIGQDVRVRTSPSSTVMPATSTSAAAVQVLDFKSSRPLVRCGCLGCDSCSSGHRFHYSFLQVRPRARHICCSANTSPCRVERTSTNKSVRPAGRKIKKGQRPALSLGRLRWIPCGGLRSPSRGGCSASPDAQHQAGWSSAYSARPIPCVGLRPCAAPRNLGG